MELIIQQSFQKWGNDNEKEATALKNNVNGKRFRQERAQQEGYKSEGQYLIYRYGYNGLLDKLRDNDFSRFKDTAYMDYTGNTCQ